MKMNHVTDLLCALLGLCTGVTSMVPAVHYSPYVEKLYEEVRSGNAPSETDPATKSIQNCKLICENIFSNRMFSWYGLLPLSRSHKFSYAEQYELLELTVADVRFEEHVLVCAFTYSSKNNIISFYVSKEYNVGPKGGSYKSGRFVFKNSGRTLDSYKIFLVEEPAVVYTDPAFDTELYYLRIRKHNDIQPVDNNSIDPLCRLISNNIEDPNNQHQRICLQVLSSPYFEDKIGNPLPPLPSAQCMRKKISFSTTRGREEATGRSYFERVTPCYVNLFHPDDGKYFYLLISRAYGSNQVFVYRRNLPSEEIHLENFMIDVSIVDELNSFDFVEY